MDKLLVEIAETGDGCALGVISGTFHGWYRRQGPVDGYFLERSRLSEFFDPGRNEASLNTMEIFGEISMVGGGRYAISPVPGTALTQLARRLLGHTDHPDSVTRVGIQARRN